MSSQTHPRLVAIVGRPNVGKSTLFNRIIRSRKSLVHNEPGVTRDRIFARAEHDHQLFYICDTGGFEPTGKDPIKKHLVHQAELAIEEAQGVIFVVDAQLGLHPEDQELIRKLRKAQKSFVVAVNKCDVPQHDFLKEDFRKLGVEFIFPVSAEHGRGIGDLLDKVLEFLPKKSLTPENPDAIRLALVGRPNVGKSSILNRLLGEERSLVDDRPGTTRDSVDVLVRYHGREIQLVDTAGIRRKSRMEDHLERFSVVRSLAALDEAHVAVLVIEGDKGPTEGDARVAGYAFERRIPILIVVNKWDLVTQKSNKTVIEHTEELRRALRYIPYAPILFCSASTNLRVSKIPQMCLELYDESTQKVSTSKLNNALKIILQKHTPPLAKGKSRKIKFLYATQVSTHPPRFVIFCSHPDDVHFSYRRFLENELRAAFGYTHVPISLILRERVRNQNGKAPLQATPEDDSFEADDLFDGEDE